jgi:hypothetical protein
LWWSPYIIFFPKRRHTGGPHIYFGTRKLCSEAKWKNEPTRWAWAKTKQRADFGPGPAGLLYIDDEVTGEWGWRGTWCVAAAPCAVGRRKSVCRRPPERTAEATPPFPTTCGGALVDSRYGRFASQSPHHSPESTACYSVSSNCSRSRIALAFLISWIFDALQFATGVSAIELSYEELACLWCISDPFYSLEIIPFLFLSRSFVFDFVQTRSFFSAQLQFCVSNTVLFHWHSDNSLLDRIYTASN